MPNFIGVKHLAEPALNVLAWTLW